MPRIIALPMLIALVLSGCGVGVNKITRLKSAGLSVGDRVVIRSDAATYECDPPDTASAFWFGSKQTKVCLKSKSDITQHDSLTGAIPAGTGAVVTALKFINGADTSYHLAYLRIPGVNGDLVVYDFNFQNLLQVTAGR